MGVTRASFLYCGDAANAGEKYHANYLSVPGMGISHLSGSTFTIAHCIGVAGTLKHCVVISESGDATTDLKVHVSTEAGSTSSETVTLDAQGKANETLGFGAVASDDKMYIEYDAGTAPGETVIVITTEES